VLRLALRVPERRLADLEHVPAARHRRDDLLVRERNRTPHLPRELVRQLVLTLLHQIQRDADNLLPRRQRRPAEGLERIRSRERQRLQICVRALFARE